MTLVAIFGNKSNEFFCHRCPFCLLVRHVVVVWTRSYRSSFSAEDILFSLLIVCIFYSIFPLFIFTVSFLSEAHLYSAALELDKSRQESMEAFKCLAITVRISDVTRRSAAEFQTALALKSFMPSAVNVRINLKKMSVDRAPGSLYLQLSDSH